MNWLGIALGIVAFICVCLPCRHDPAIRLKEWLDAMDKEGPDDH
jgi:hypothetical protein